MISVCDKGPDIFPGKGGKTLVESELGLDASVGAVENVPGKKEKIRFAFLAQGHEASERVVGCITEGPGHLRDILRESPEGAVEVKIRCMDECKGSQGMPHFTNGHYMLLNSLIQKRQEEIFMYFSAVFSRKLALVAPVLFLLSAACQAEPQKTAEPTKTTDAKSDSHEQEKTCAFSTHPGGDGQAAQQASPHGGGMSIGSPRIQFHKDIRVEKAVGPESHNVAELYSLKDGLSGKVVTVRGQVVKVSLGIMGKNWLHIQDGSGDAAKGDYDLTVTTATEAVVGDTVLVKGTFVTNKDFGHGYLYDIIIEDAEVQREKTS